MGGKIIAAGEQEILAGYAMHAAELIPRFEALSTEDVLAPVVGLLPTTPGLILDIGAGTGRDAAWLADRGHHVVAVEPVDELRSAGMSLHPSPNIEWVDDCLPCLANVRGRGETYDLILLVGVWHHLPREKQAGTIPIIAQLAAVSGRLILSVRHGPGPPERAVFPVRPRQIVSAAREAGLHLVLHRTSPSIQEENRRAGIWWTWLCFER